MILVDSSVWIDHLRSADSKLQELLTRRRVLSHPFVIGEVALGTLKRREAMVVQMQALPKATTANDDEVLGFIARHALSGVGVGYIDVHLLASVSLTRDALLWTRNKRLHAIAVKLGFAASESGEVVIN